MIIALRHHDILQLQVTMHNAKAVQVAHSKHNLINDGLGTLLWQLVVSLGDVVK